MKEKRIIDAHVHIFPEKIVEKAVDSIGKYYGITMSCKGTIEDLIENGNKINVYKYVVHSTATKVEQVETINNFIAQAKVKNNALIGFGTLHPGLSDIDCEVNRIMSLGLKGIKLHPDFQDFNIDDEDMLPIYKAIEGKLPVLIHMGDESRTSSRPERLVRIMKLFPRLTIIAAHLGGYQMWEEAAQYLLGENIYLDTSSTLPFLKREKVVAAIRKHGANKILFGTDYPMWSHEEELERFKSLGLTEEEEDKILFENASKLLNII